MSNIGRYARPLRLAVLPLLAVVGVAVFLLVRPHSATDSPLPHRTIETSSESAPVHGSAAVDTTAAANQADEIAPDVLAQAIATWRDPFQAEATALVSMQEKIKLKEKEIEVLKLALEEKKLRDQLRGANGDSLRTTTAGGMAANGTAVAVTTTGRVTVKALLCSESRRAALLSNGSTTAWVSEGDSFDNLRIVKLDSDAATFVNSNGRRVVIAMQR